MSVCPTCYGLLDTGYNCPRCGGGVKTFVFRDGTLVNDDKTPFDEEVIVVCPKCHGESSQTGEINQQGYVIRAVPCLMCGGSGRMKAKVTGHVQ